MRTKSENNTRFYPKRKDIALVYVGEGETVGDVPPRDLHPGEVIRYGGRLYLLRTRLYVEPDMIIHD